MCQRQYVCKPHMWVDVYILYAYTFKSCGQALKEVSTAPSLLLCSSWNTKKETRLYRYVEGKGAE